MLELQTINKTYTTEQGQEVPAIRNFSLSIKEGEFVAFIGPSGCGKTTLLKLIAGLETPSEGKIFLDKKPVVKPASERGMVFQHFSLFPWLTVKENIIFGQAAKGLNKKKLNDLADHYLKITGLEDFSGLYPKNLSGGMQQRVAIARTLANNPTMLLMDEPFGALDAQTRSRMQEFLTNVWEKEKKTVVFVTHEVKEAIFLADKVYVCLPRPMAIKKTFDIPFARPRLHSLKVSKEFLELEIKITQALEG